MWPKSCSGGVYVDLEGWPRIRYEIEFIEEKGALVVWREEHL